MIMMKIKGIHHISAITGDAQENLNFYRQTMGLRLVKKTVNQDDTSVYHLFYGDEKGNPGTELTFFAIPRSSENIRGNNSISTISLRLKDDESLSYWLQRLDDHGVSHGHIVEQLGRLTLAFQDPEGQRLQLVSDEKNEGVAGGVPWELSPVPQEHGIIGLGPVHLTVKKKESTSSILTDILGFRLKGHYSSTSSDENNVSVYETDAGGTGTEVHIAEEKDSQSEHLGRGGVHHVAFRVNDEQELNQWVETIQNKGIPNSGFVDRFYFRSLYFREPSGILFELATDGPGFDTDEELDTLGQSLALPPFLEDQREIIESRLKPIF